MLAWVPQPFGSNWRNQRVRDAFRRAETCRRVVVQSDPLPAAAGWLTFRHGRRATDRHLAAPIPDPLLRTLRLRAACTRTGRRAPGAVRGGGRDRGRALRAVRRAARRQAGGVQGWLLAAGDDSWRTAPGAAPGLDREASRGSRRRCLRDRACTSGRTSEQASTVKTPGGTHIRTCLAPIVRTPDALLRSCARSCTTLRLATTSVSIVETADSIAFA